MINRILDLALGPCVRRIRTGQAKTIYLTFDDGPDVQTTPAVLDILARHEARATFFVIANKAKANQALLKRIQTEGHAIGNHSLDHRYSRFFTTRARMKKWINDSERLLADLTGESTVGFRPPAGIRTPELHWALKEINTPLVLWEKRFFDTTITLSKKRALRSLKATHSGSIVLMHDSQAAAKLNSFSQALSAYLDSAKEFGFAFNPLTRQSCIHANFKTDSSAPR